MSDAFWNNIFSKPEFHYGTSVNAWVEQATREYILNGRWFANLGIDSPDELTVVELAAGEGRNAVWLAQQGFEITAVDTSEVGIRKARRRAEREQVNVTFRTEDALDLHAATSGWDELPHVVVSTFFHVHSNRKRELYRAHRELTRPGGLVIAEWFHPDQRTLGYTSGGPPRREMLVGVAEVLTAFADWKILTCRSRVRILDEGSGHRGEGVVTQFAAQKPLS
jgi:SAM-dependent methyltransferase